MGVQWGLHIVKNAKSLFSVRIFPEVQIIDITEGGLPCRSFDETTSRAFKISLKASVHDGT